MVLLADSKASIALTFERTHVTEARILVGPRCATLVGFQQMTVTIGAAIGIARIDRRTAREQRDRLGGTAVVGQVADLGVGVVHIAPAVEIAGVVAAQVVAI